MESLWSKTDIITAYGCGSCKEFERRVPRHVLIQIGWGKGRQFFTPNAIRLLFNLIGKPLEKAELK